jgi:putative transposase
MVPSMPRKARVAPGGLVYHVLNRAAGRLTLFRREEDYAAFERVMLEAHRRCPLRVLSYCLMPNHWHFVAWPRRDGELTAFFRWLTHTHAMRWRVAHHSVGRGPLYQGRFKSFPVQRDEHLSTVCRYVERNALSGGLVRRAEAWRHGSLWTRDAAEAPLRAVLCDWPAGRPADWVRHVNQPLSRRELQRLAEGERRGRPFGGDEWVGRTVAKLGLQHTVRPPGRPRTAAKGKN